MAKDPPECCFNKYKTFGRSNWRDLSEIQVSGKSKPKVWRVNSLTSMRGIAAISVLLYHAWAITFYGATAKTSPIWASFLVFGASGVSFFFVLSGYLLIRKWLQGDYKSLKDFYVRRIFRTFPLYYITMAVATVLLGGYVFHLDSLFYIQEYFPSTFDHSVFWTLCAEETFYFSLPILMKTVFSTKRTTVVTTIFSAILAVAFYAYFYSSYNLAFFTIPYWFVSYSFGALLAHGIRPRIGKLPAIILLLGVWMVITIAPPSEVWGTSYFPVSSTYVYINGLLYSSLLSILFWVLIPTFENNRFLNKNPVTIYLGTISYSIYIWHDFILHWVRVNIFVPPPMPLNYSLLVGCLGICVAILSYHLIEKPFIQLGKKIVSAKASVTA